VSVEEEARLLEVTLRRFLQRLEAEDPEADPARREALLKEAEAIGLLADPDPEAPGFATGIWGRWAWTERLGLSLHALARLGEACAGFALALHAQGIACAALEGARVFPRGTRLALGGLLADGISPSPFAGEEENGLRVTGPHDHPLLEGRSWFLISAGPPQGLLLFARAAEDSSWALIALPADLPGVRLEPLPERLGLRGAWMGHLHAGGVLIAQEGVARILARGEEAHRRLRRLLALDWLGHAAIALGVARRSLDQARAYARTRYQGGRRIIAHGPVRSLLGTAAADGMTLELLLKAHAEQPLAALSEDVLERWAAIAKLAIAEHAWRAVSNSLQVMGGYGYMEDQGLAGRLRDVSTLRVLHGSPDRIRLRYAE